MNSDDELWMQYHRTKDINIRNALVEKYSYLVRIIALKTRGIYQQYGSVEDAINEGMLALLDVIDKYDLSKHVKFETFATIRIRGAIIDYVRSQDWIPRRVKQNMRDIDEAVKELSDSMMRMPTDAEISEKMDIPLDLYNKMVNHAHLSSIVSFEETLNEVVENRVSHEDAPEDVLIKHEMIEYLAKCIDTLNKNERMVIALYYKEEMRIKDIAEILKVSKSRASQIHSAALEKLGKCMKKYENGEME